MTEPFLATCPSCQAQLRIKNLDLIGTEIACPSCRQKFLLEDSDADSSSVAERRNVVDDSLEDSDSSTSSKSAGKRSSLPQSSGARRKGLILALAIGGVVAAGVTAFMLFKGSPLPQLDTRWLDDETDVLVHIRVAELAKSPQVQQVLQDQQIRTYLDAWTERFSIPFEQIDSIVIGFSNLTMQFPANAPLPERYNIVIRTLTPIAPEMLLKEKASASAVPLESTQYYRLAAIDGPPDWVAHFPDKNTVVLADEPTIIKLVKRNGPSACASRVSLINANQHVCLAFVPENPNMLDNLARNSGRQMPQSPSTQFRSFCFGMELGTQLKLCMDYEANSALDAMRNRRVTEQDRFMMKSGITSLRGQLQMLPFPFIRKPPLERAIGYLEQATDTMKAGGWGRAVRGEMTVNPQIIPDLYEAIGPLIPLAAAAAQVQQAEQPTDDADTRAAEDAAEEEAQEAPEESSNPVNP